MSCRARSSATGRVWLARKRKDSEVRGVIVVGLPPTRMAIGGQPMIYLIVLIIIIVLGLGYQKFRGAQALTFTYIDVAGLSLDEASGVCRTPLPIRSTDFWAFRITLLRW